MKRFNWQLLTAAVIVVACNMDGLDFDNLEGPTLSGKAAIPIGNVSYTFRELIEKVGDDELDLHEDENTSQLFLIYRDTAEFDNGNEIINIDSVVNSDTLVLKSTPAVTEPTTQTVQNNFQLRYYSQNNEEIDEIFYKEGLASLSVSATFDHDFSYTATLLDTKTTSEDVPMVFTADGNQSLTGFYTELSDTTINGEKQNIFLMDFSMDIFLEAGDSISSNSKVIIRLEFIDQEFYLVHGKFGQDIIKVGDETLNIDFFDDLGESGFVFGNPTMSFVFHNSFGLPLAIDFGGLYGLEGDSTSADTTFLSGSIVNNPPTIEGAETVGAAKVTDTVFIDNSNSNLVNLLSSSPNSLGFKISGITNPEDATKTNFVLDTSHITSYIELELPMELQLNDVTRDVDFSLGKGLKFSETDSLIMRIITTNEIPFSAYLDLEIYDQNDSLSYTVTNHQAITTPEFNLDGSVKRSREHTEDIPIGEKGIAALNEGKRLNLRITISTPKSSSSKDFFVDLLADYVLGIQVSAAGTLTKDL